MFLHHLQLTGHNGKQGVLEQELHGIEDKLSSVSSVSHTTEFINISGLNRPDSILGLLKSGESSSEFFISLFLLNGNSVFLGNTSLSDSSDFSSLDVGLLVLDFKFTKEGSGLVGGNLKSGVLFLKINLKSIDTLGCFSELV